MLRQKIDELDEGLGVRSWTTRELDCKWKPEDSENIKFYHRDIVEATQWLLQQSYHEDHMVYIAGHRYRDGVRNYDEMWTGDWWIQRQVIPVVYTTHASC